MTVGGWIAIGVTAVALLIGAVMTTRPLRALLMSAVEGIAALAAVNVLGGFTGVTLGLTPFTAAVCAALGMPGTVTLLVLQAMVR